MLFFKDTNVTSAPTHEECQDITAEPMQQESSQHSDSLLPALHASLKRTHSHDEESIELLSPGKRSRLEDKCWEGNKSGGHPEAAITKVADSPMPMKDESMAAMKDEPIAIQEAPTDTKAESSEPIKLKNLKLETEKELELVKSSQTLDRSQSNAEQSIGDQAELLETKDDKLKQEDDPKLQIVFSDEEDEGVAGGSHMTGGGRMLSSQMNRQIDCVQVFLKLERLRRPKK